MAIEIVSFLRKMVDLSIAMLNYQRVDEVEVSFSFHPIHPMHKVLTSSWDSVGVLSGIGYASRTMRDVFLPLFDVVWGFEIWAISVTEEWQILDHKHRKATAGHWMMVDSCWFMLIPFFWRQKSSKKHQKTIKKHQKHQKSTKCKSWGTPAAESVWSPHACDWDGILMDYPGGAVEPSHVTDQVTSFLVPMGARNDVYSRFFFRTFQEIVPSNMGLPENTISQNSMFNSV